MLRKMVCLVSFLLVLSLVGNVFAVVTWTDAGADHLWSTPTNWDTGALPTANDEVYLQTLPGPTIVNQGPEANMIRVGRSAGEGAMTVQGGLIAVAQYIDVGIAGANTGTLSGTLNMYGGTITAGTNLNIGANSQGVLNMTGGTIILNSELRIGREATGVGHVNLDGGTLIIHGNFVMRMKAGAVGTMDISGGTMIVDGDKLSAIQQYIADGWITAYDGDGTLQLDYDLANPGKTTLIAIEKKKAIKPVPANGQTDLPRNTVLGWTSGVYADKHDVYFGTNPDDVREAGRTDPRGVLVSQGQIDTSYDPGRLALGQTYYWRVDEVNAPPSSTIFKGETWSFTVEPLAYPIAGDRITATASSSNSAAEGPENTINGSGLDADGLHGTDPTTMWLSSAAETQPAWILYAFDRAYKLNQIRIWNYNAQGLNAMHGLKGMTIEYSLDGANYTQLGTCELDKAAGMMGSAAGTPIDLGNVVTKYVRISAGSNWSDGILHQYGLSEVQFLSIPLSAQEPDPVSGTTDAAVAAALSWRPGREAAKHNVYLSTDQQAVIDGTAPVVTVTSPSYATSLNLASTYYWRVDEVNDVETPSMWAGDIWSLSTQEYLVVDDFESYNDIDPPAPQSHRIFESWIDGYGVTTNGALVGNDPPNPSYAETVIVHSGKQSMPLTYSNTGGASSSETTYRFVAPQDWTMHGIKTLSLWFYGSGSNTSSRLYVKVNNAKVLYDGDADHLARLGWQSWNIDLASVGTDLHSVTSLTIGIDGSGAAGKVCIDDIRLYAYDRQLVTPIEPQPLGLGGSWSFEGNGNDSSINGRNGALMANPMFASGKAGQAINFDGLDDYVAITGYKGVAADRTDSANPVQGAFSISCWINTSGNGDMVSWGSADGKPVGGQYVRFWVDTATLRIEHGNGNLRGNTIVSDGQWHHVAAVVNTGANLRAPGTRLFVDGQEDSTFSGSDNIFNITADVDAAIGVRNTNMTSFFSGLIDEVRIYERVLTDGEIAWLAGKTLPYDASF